MNIKSIKARNKYSSFDGKTTYIRGFVVILIGAVLSLTSFFYFENILSLFTLLFCSIVVLVLVMMPPEEIEVSVTKDGVMINKNITPWNTCHSWVMVDLGDVIEFIIQTTNLDNSYYYFYVDPEQEGFAEFLVELSKVLPYNEEIENTNTFHKIMRFIGLA